MSNHELTKLLLALILVLCFTGADCAAQELTTDEATAAIKSQLAAQRRDVPQFRVKEVLGCIPAFVEGSTAASKFVCALSGDFSGATPDEPQFVSFENKSGGWIALPNERFSPSCAPIADAERELRRIRKDDGLRVIKEIDNGQGSFTTERGISRDKKGLLRVMCRYDVKRSAEPDADTLFISYLWFQNGKYIFDSDVEVWYD